MKFARSILTAAFLAFIIAPTLVACSPEPGSKDWCADMKEKDKGQWTADEAGIFAKNCIL